MKVRWVAANANPKIASVRIRALCVIEGLRRLAVDAALMTASRESISVAVFCKSYRQRDIELARELKRRGTVIIFDLCDNHFVLGRSVVDRLREMMRLADVWVFSTPSLQSLATQAMGEERTSCVIPDAVEVEQRSWVRSDLRRHWADWKLRVWERRSRLLMGPHSTRLIWFGNHAGSASDTGMSQLRKLRSTLEQCASECSATLTVVSNSHAAYRQVTQNWRIQTFYMEWNLATFLPVLRMHAIALLPFDSGDFNSVKSNNRLALSVYHGVAVVADAIPSYREFSDAAILDDWSGIRRYMEDENLRTRDLARARARVEECYSLEVVARQWRSLLLQVGAK